MQPEAEPVVVCTVADPIEAEIIKSSLEAADIKCVLDGINQADAVHLPNFDIKVTVASSQEREARELLAEHDRIVRERRRK